MPSTQPSESARPWWLHIAGLWAFVVALPLLDLIARHPDFLTAHHARRAEVLGLPLALVVLCPALLILAIWIVGLGRTLARALAVDACVGALVALLAMQLGRLVESRAVIVVPLACTAGVVCAVAYHRRAWVRTLASVLGLSVVVVPVAFWLRPDVRRILAAGSDRSVIEERSWPSTRTPVIIVVFDEVSLVSLLDGGGRIDPVLYPNLASLSREGIWFRNATTVSDFTRWALPPIVTGRRPRAELSPSARDHAESIFSLLARTHRVDARESVTDLCPERVCSGQDQPFRASAARLAADLLILYQHVVLTEDLTRDLPALSGQWAGFQDAGRPAASRRRRDRSTPSPDSRMSLINRFIADVERADGARPGLYFLHSMLSHSPSWLLPSGQVDGTRASAAALRLPDALPGRRPGVWPEDDWAVAQAHQRYLLQLGFVDTVIGRLVSRLKAAGIYDQSLVAVLSDHGAAFSPGLPRRHFTEQTAAEIMRIPLILKLPAGSPARIDGTVVVDGANVNDRNVETIDLLPTIADVLGISLPWTVDGASLLDPATNEGDMKILFHDSARRRRAYDPEGPDVSPAVQRKLAVFGGGDNPFRIPRPPSFAELVGQKPDRLQIARGGCAVAVDYLSDFSRMTRDSDVVPFEVAGRFESRLQPDGLPFVAVAVNGTIRAVTRGWRSAPGEWLATPPLDVWRDGRNVIDVFAIERSTGGPLLRRCTVREGRSH